jgi:hypothetical protein
MDVSEPSHAVSEKTVSKCAGRYTRRPGNLAPLIAMRRGRLGQRRFIAATSRVLGAAITLLIAIGAGAEETVAATDSGTATVTQLSSDGQLVASHAAISLRAQRLPDGRLRVSANATLAVTQGFSATLSISPCNAYVNQSLLPSAGPVVFWRGRDLVRAARLTRGHRHALKVSGTVTSNVPGESQSPNWTDCAEADLADSTSGALLFDGPPAFGAGGAMVLLTLTSTNGDHIPAAGTSGTSRQP